MSGPQDEALTDQELVRRASARDVEAFGALVLRHQASVFRLAHLLSRRRDEAEDILQQTFLSAWQHVDRFRGDASVRTWLLAIARNAALSRRARVSKEPIAEVSVDDLGVSAGWGGDPEALAIAGERHDLLHEAWRRLAPDDQEILTLRDLEGLSGEETASMLAITLPAMKSRLHRARLALATSVRERMSHAAR